MQRLLIGGNPKSQIGFPVAQPLDKEHPCEIGWPLDEETVTENLREVLTSSAFVYQMAILVQLGLSQMPMVGSRALLSAI
jgi:hypothetical protein